MARRLPTIALVADERLHFDRAVVQGVTRYAQYVEPLDICFDAEGPARLPRVMDLPIDGVIGHFRSEATCNAARALAVPIVGIAGIPMWRHGQVRISSDDVVALAADHLLGLGVRHLAYVGIRGLAVAEGRGDHLASLAQKAGVSFARYDLPRRSRGQSHWGMQMQKLGNWLASLERPTGLLCNNDERAQQVIQACRGVGVNVPQDIAVLGVDNDRTRCMTTNPQLSSVDLGIEHLGFEAAQLLVQIIRGEWPADTIIDVLPSGIAARQSTELIAVNDAVVSEAIRIIRDRAHEPVQVTEIATEAGVSRRVLEQRFRTQLNMTPRQIIERAHLDRARKLLIETDWAMPRIAQASGYSGGARRLAKVFQRVEKCTPTQFRSRHRKR